MGVYIGFDNVGRYAGENTGNRVKIAEIAYSKRQIERIRARLQAGNTPTPQITRPRYDSGRLMDIKRFETLVERLIKHEKRVDRLAEEGLLKWFNRTY